jgi:Lar family restriction alleviation protein
MTDPRLIALSSNPGQVEPGPFSEHDLREQWNAQADQFNQWESLDSSEQLAWAQTRAIAAQAAAQSEAWNTQKLILEIKFLRNKPDELKVYKNNYEAGWQDACNRILMIFQSAPDADQAEGPSLADVAELCEEFGFTPALLPCPFCGSADDDNDLRRVIDGEWENVWIECDRCGAQGALAAMQQLPIDNISDEDFIKAKRLVDAEASAAAIAAWNQRSAWQPIETAPRDGTQILGWDGDARQIVWWCEGGRWISDKLQEYHLGEREDPTHWQPLPSPPTTLTPMIDANDPAFREQYPNGAIVRDRLGRQLHGVEACDPETGEVDSWVFIWGQQQRSHLFHPAPLTIEPRR